MHPLHRLAPIAIALSIAALGCSEKVVDPNPPELLGIGVELTMDAAGARVVRVLPGSPAADQGVEAGEVFLEVDGASLRGLALAEVVQRIRGEAGTRVQILARTPGGNLQREIERRRVANPGAP